MWKELAAGVVSNAAALVIVWLVLVAILSAFVQRHQIPLLGRAYLRLFKMAIASPLSFARKTVEEFCDADLDEERKSFGSDQYLLRKVLLGLKGTMVVLSFGLLAFGIVGTWALLPGQSEFQQVAKLRESLQQLEVSLRAQEEKLIELEDLWRSDAKRPKYDEILALESRVSASGAKQSRALDTLRMYRRFEELREQVMAPLPKPPMPLEEAEINRLADEARSRISPNLKGETAVAITDWIRGWQDQALAHSGLMKLEVGFRAQRQGGYREAITAYSEDYQSQASQSQELEGLIDLIGTRRVGAVLTFFGAISGFLGLLWFLGLVVEAFSLVIRVAGDVRDLRNSQRLATPPIPPPMAPVATPNPGLLAIQIRTP
jgi:hypothetical protein